MFVNFFFNLIFKSDHLLLRSTLTTSFAAVFAVCWSSRKSCLDFDIVPRIYVQICMDLLIKATKIPLLMHLPISISISFYFLSFGLRHTHISLHRQNNSQDNLAYFQQIFTTSKIICWFLKFSENVKINSIEIYVAEHYY